MSVSFSRDERPDYVGQICLLKRQMCHALLCSFPLSDSFDYWKGLWFNNCARRARFSGVLVSTHSFHARCKIVWKVIHTVDKCIGKPGKTPNLPHILRGGWSFPKENLRKGLVRDRRWKCGNVVETQVILSIQCPFFVGRGPALWGITDKVGFAS